MRCVEAKRNDVEHQSRDEGCYSRNLSCPGERSFGYGRELEPALRGLRELAAPLVQAVAREWARMARKRFTAGQIIMKLREAEVGLALGVDFKGPRGLT